MEQLLYNAQVVTSEEVFLGGVTIDREGKIGQVFRGALSPELKSQCEKYECRDLQGCYLLPGMVDTHVHFREPGLTAKADMESESRAAVAGGVTSYLDMPNTLPPTLSLEALEEKLDLAHGRSYANYGFYIGASPENLELLPKADPHKVAGIKLFMGTSTGRLAVTDERSLRLVFSTVELPLLAHCEDDAIISANFGAVEAILGPDIPFVAHSYIRSAQACLNSSKKAIELAMRYRTRLHVLHLSTAEEVHQFARMAEAGLTNVTGELCPHYLWYSTLDYTRLGGAIKCNPAIKGPRHREALREAAASQAFFTVGTDHAPHLWQEKQQEYRHCPSGIPTIQYGLLVLLELCYQQLLSLPRIAALYAANPAQLLDIAHRGSIAPGNWADLVVVARHETPQPAQPVLSKCGWSPLAQESYHHTIEATLINGQVVYQKGQVVGQPQGQPLSYAR